MATSLFDTWTDRYDSWFATPIGQLVRWYEAELLLAFLEPNRASGFSMSAAVPAFSPPMSSNPEPG
jgi:hypothetical protein